MVAFEETPEYKMGHSAEAKWCRLLASAGRVALPAYGAVGVDESTKAPVLFAAGGKLVSPDVLCMSKERGHSWHEVKAKSVPVWYRKLRRYEHGIDYSLLMEYQEVQDQTGIPVVMVVYETRSPTLPAQDSREMPESGIFLWAKLSDVLRVGTHRKTWPGGKWNPRDRGRHGEGGWLWPRDVMTEHTG